MGRLLALGLSALAGALIASCAGGDAADRPSKCVVGQQTTCACSGGIKGVQVCKDDGSGYGPCGSCGLAGTGGWPGYDGGGQGGNTGGASGGSAGAVASGGSAGAGGAPLIDADVPDAAPKFVWAWVDHGGPPFQSHACSGPAGVVDGMLVDPQAFFQALVQGKDANDWVQVLNAIEGQLWACGLGQQRDSGGNVRGRLFLPHANCPDASPPPGDALAIKLGVRQEPPCWEHFVDVLADA